MSTPRTIRAASDSLWLIQTSAEDERTAQIQPYRCMNSDWSTDGPLWQVSWNAPGIERLRTKWQQGGKPQLAMDIRGTREILDPFELNKAAKPVSHSTNNNGTAQPKKPQTSSCWVICAPGYAFDGAVVHETALCATHWKMLQASRLPVWAACRILLSTPGKNAHEPLEIGASGEGLQANPVQASGALINGAAAPAVTTCLLTRSYLLRPGQTWSDLHVSRRLHAMPSALAWTVALSFLGMTSLNNSGLLALAAQTMHTHTSALTGTEPEQISSTSKPNGSDPADPSAQLRAACNTLRGDVHESN